MRKKILLIGMVAFTLFIGYEATTQKSEKKISLLLENAEALADEEWNDHILCYGVGSVDCPANHTKVEYYDQLYSLD